MTKLHVSPLLEFTAISSEVWVIRAKTMFASLQHAENFQPLNNSPLLDAQFSIR